MVRFSIWLAWWSLTSAWQSPAAELSFDFWKFRLNESPPGFRSTVSGQGEPGQWRVILDEVASAFPRLTPNAPVETKRPVLAQLSQDPTDEHFPLLMYEGETFQDFVLTTRFKTVSGEKERMAGIVFRYQDEKNYYYVRASSLGNTFRFFKYVNGQRSDPIGAEVEIPSGVWHHLTVECQGTRIRCLLNNQELFPALNDSSFSEGKLGFWTKSDSVSYFVDTHIRYKPRVPFVQTLISEMMQKYPRLRGLRLYALQTGKPNPVVVASSNPKDLALPGGDLEENVILRDAVYYGKNNNEVLVTLPLHDRNGDTVGAVRVAMQSFRGQTEQNAIARALPIVKEMELRLRSSRENIR